MQKKLPSLKPGQVVQFTYTEAIAASIRPAPAEVTTARSAPTPPRRIGAAASLHSRRAQSQATPEWSRARPVRTTSVVRVGRRSTRIQPWAIAVVCIPR